MSDPISDMLTRIRNAQKVGHDEVFIPFSKLKFRIGEILKEQGFIENIDKQDDSGKSKMRIVLKYYKGTGVIQHLEIVSKPGMRIYIKKSELPKVLQGLGMAIISTSRGIMTDKEAREKKLGGEFICKIW
ncbi:MAG: SSU ribosomal protein S8P [uncultured bacterium]|nr:MAG: SSU ribosomal protein S8P [uncultured bacterium]